MVTIKVWNNENIYELFFSQKNINFFKFFKFREYLQK